MKFASSSPSNCVKPDNGVSLLEDSESITFVKRLRAVQSQITQACKRAGRNPSEVRLLPVSKTVSLTMMRAAIAAGCQEFGEEGADVVRVGQAFFGSRGVPDSHYWPGLQGTGAP